MRNQFFFVLFQKMLFHFCLCSFLLAIFFIPLRQSFYFCKLLSAAPAVFHQVLQTSADSLRHVLLFNSKIMIRQKFHTLDVSSKSCKKICCCNSIFYLIIDSFYNWKPDHDRSVIHQFFRFSLIRVFSVPVYSLCFFHCQTS